jgi:hypothetical protein
VEFEATDSDRGPKAVSVRLIEKHAGPSGPSPWSIPAVKATSAVMVPPVPRPATPVDSPAPTPTVTAKEATAETEDDLCDVLTASAFIHDLTEQLLEGMPTLTAAQISELRKTFLTFARKHNWVED